MVIYLAVIIKNFYPLPNRSCIVDRDLYVRKFKDHLREGDTFSFNKIDELQWCVESKYCKITFDFDRYGEGGCLIFVSDPNSNTREANFITLRHIRGARNVLSDGGSPENLAEIFDKYFNDILNGDFSIFTERDRLGKVFSLHIMEAIGLNDEDPVKVKFINYDISWLDDLKKRRGL